MIFMSVVILGVILVTIVIYNALMESQKTKLTKLKSKRDSLKIKVNDLREKIPSMKLEAEVLRGKVSMLNASAAALTEQDTDGDELVFDDGLEDLFK